MLQSCLSAQFALSEDTASLLQQGVVSKHSQWTWPEVACCGQSTPKVPGTSPGSWRCLAPTESLEQPNRCYQCDNGDTPRLSGSSVLCTDGETGSGTTGECPCGNCAVGCVPVSRDVTCTVASSASGTVFPATWLGETFSGCEATSMKSTGCSHNPIKSCADCEATDTTQYIDFPEGAAQEDYIGGPPACKGTICTCAPVTITQTTTTPVTTTCRVAPWGKCGGDNGQYDGCTVCAEDHYCAYGNQWYSDCRPGVAPGSGAGSGAGFGSNR